jgi:Tol biopolymer transport system component
MTEYGISPEVMNGVWNAAGSLFFFTARTDGADNVWVAHERNMGRFNENSKPVPLTNGPGDWRWPVVSERSKEIFAIHSVSEPQLTSLDGTNKEWRPFWNGAPFYEMEFSHDGTRTTFIRYPDYTLWTANVEGGDRIQLTHGEVEAHEPHWSADGSQIAFMGRRKGEDWRIEVISARGGPAVEPLPSGKGQGVPTWSPDGKGILFGDRTEAKPGPNMNVHYVDLATHAMKDLPNSYGLWSPRWSPDGKYIAAPSFDGTNLSLLKWPESEWKNVLRMRAIENVMWSPDSRYIYFKGRKVVDCSELYRLRVADGKLDMVVDLKDFRWAAETWFGLTPTGTPLALYESSPQEVFAIDYELR